MGDNLRFSGKIPIQNGFLLDLAVDLSIHDGVAVLATDQEVLGTWPLARVSVTRLRDSRFLLELGDEETIFHADDVLGMSYDGMRAINGAAEAARTSKGPGRRNRTVVDEGSGHSGGPRARAIGHSRHPDTTVPARPVADEDLDRLRDILGSAYGAGRTAPAPPAKPAAYVPEVAHSGALLERARAASVRETEARITVWKLPQRARRIHTAVIAASVLAIILFLPRIGPAVLGPLGLASELPVVVYLAFAGLVIGFAVSAVRHPSRRLMACYVGAMAVVLHGMGALVYEFPRYSWAWKHAGIVDYILRHGSVDPSLDALSAYHNWPGFFGLSALVTETAGLTSPLSFAAWAPIFFNLVYLAALYLLYRAFTADERMIWTALMIFTIGNWIGQDYFAPQASAYLFYLLIVGILLNWFPERASVRIRLGNESVMAATLFLLIVAVVVSHQLTPVMVVITTVALFVARRTKLGWPPALAAGLLLLWLGSFASPFAEDYLPKVWADLQGLMNRVDAGLIDQNQVDVSQKVVSQATRALSVGLVGLGALGFLRSFRTGIRWRAAMFLIGSPALLVVASSYGNEVLFRALLFGLPIFALLGSALWFSREPGGRGLVAQATLAAVLLGMIPLSIVAQHGNDVRTVFSAGEVRVAGLMYEVAPPGSAVIQLSNDYPTKFTNYEHLAELTVASFSSLAKERVMEDPARVFASWGIEGGYTETYVLLTRSQAASVTRLGTMPPDAYEVIDGSLRQSDRFEMLTANEDGALFRLVPGAP